MLGYTQWRSFEAVIDKAKLACANGGQAVDDHFADVSKMVDIGSGTQRPVDDLALTRSARYLIAQNGDPRKDAFAFAMTCFAVQTRKQELIEARIAERERLRARDQLSLSQMDLSGVLYERDIVALRHFGHSFNFSGASARKRLDTDSSSGRQFMFTNGGRPGVRYSRNGEPSGASAST